MQSYAENETQRRSISTNSAGSVETGDRDDVKSLAPPAFQVTAQRKSPHARNEKKPKPKPRKPAPKPKKQAPKPLKSQAEKRMEEQRKGLVGKWSG